MIAWICAQHQVYAQTTVNVTGKLIDRAGDPAPFTTIQFKSDLDDQLTVTKVDGTFALTLNANAKYTAIIDDPRFKKQTIRILTGKDAFVVEWTLEWRKTAESQTYLNVDTKNPANEVVKNAIRKRNVFFNMVDYYKADAYSKSQVEITHVKAKFPRIWFLETVPDSSQLGMVYMSEHNSTLYYRNHPQSLVEDVTATRIYGKETEFSIQSRLLPQLSFYDARIQLFEFSNDYYLSPIGWGAFMYYRYELIEKYYNQGSLIYRIKVIPKNEYGKVFRGEISIASSSWALTGLDLTLAKTTGLYRVDSVNIQQQFKKVKKQYWMPSSTKVKAWNTVYGSTTEYSAQVFIKNYNLDAPIERDVLSLQLVHADKKAENYDPAYWRKVRGKKLGDDEEELFNQTDSVLDIQVANKMYQDSVSRLKKDKFYWYHPFLGHTIENKAKSKSFYYDGLLNDKIEFNTVEGFTYKYTVFYRKQYRKGWLFELEPTLRFGFADMRPKGKLMLRFSNNKNQQVYEIDGGSYYFQINQSEPINSFINSIYTLFFRNNYMKLYRKDYFRFHHQREITNGLFFSNTFEFANRNTVENATLFSFTNISGSDFTPNNPNAATDSNYRLVNNKAVKVKLGITYKPKQKYMMLGGKKVILGSDLPVFSIFYTRGLPNFLSSDVNYDLLEFTITDEIHLGLVGNSSYIFKAGVYLSQDMTYLDYTHFLGERTYFLGSARNGTYLDQFRALEYYQYSTNAPFIELHYQHDFLRFPWDQIPLLKKLKWNMFTGFNFLQTFGSQSSNYSEMFIGFDNLLGGLKATELFNVRVDVAMQIRNGKEFIPTFLVGFGLRFWEKP